MTIRVFSFNDVGLIAELHKKAFSNFFLANLGYKFLVNFYKAILNDPNSINIGLFENELLIGFAVGSKRSKSFYKNLFIKNFIELSFSAVVPLISNPNNIVRLLTSLISFSKSNLDIIDDSVLLSICIDPNCSSKGFGKILLTEFEKRAFKYSKIITLTTDADDNDYVNAFYSKNGYELNHSFYQGKRKMNYYKKNILI
jgi:ribosomal protein S18 acetylase RimI-like enzyme